MIVVGVDASREGWVGVRLDSGAFSTAKGFTRFSDVLDAFPEAAIYAVDIPIGFVPGGRRKADSEARRFVGPRASSVFPAPIREVLEAPDQRSANVVAQALGEGGVSAQSYALRPKILEVDQHVQDSQVIEIHPEVSFRAMAGRPLVHAKRTWNGFVERIALLAANGIAVPLDRHFETGCAPDDLLDACAAAWTARRCAAGHAESLPSVRTQVDRGREIAIWY